MCLMFDRPILDSFIGNFGGATALLVFCLVNRSLRKRNLVQFQNWSKIGCKLSIRCKFFVDVVVATKKNETIFFPNFPVFLNKLLLFRFIWFFGTTSWKWNKVHSVVMKISLFVLSDKLCQYKKRFIKNEKKMFFVRSGQTFIVNLIRVLFFGLPYVFKSSFSKKIKNLWQHSE